VLPSTFHLFGFEVQSRSAASVALTVDRRRRKRCASTYKDDVISSEAKDLKLRILRPFGVSAPQDDGVTAPLPQ